MSEGRTRKWPINANKNNHLNSEEAARAKELFEKYDGIKPPYAELSEDDAVLFLVWVTGFHPSEARWSVRGSRGEKVQLDGTVDLGTLSDEQLRDWAGSDERYEELRANLSRNKN